jgi:hypothetical protein
MRAWNGAWLLLAARETVAEGNTVPNGIPQSTLCVSVHDNGDKESREIPDLYTLGSLPVVGPS